MSDEYVTRPSENHVEYKGGAVRSSQEGKPRFDLIPPGPLRRVAMLYARGAELHEDFNWTKGQPTSRIWASLERHVQDFKEGDRVEDHLAAVIWNAFAMMQFEGTDWDDMFDWSSLPGVHRD